MRMTAWYTVGTHCTFVKRMKEYSSWVHFTLYVLN